MAPEVLKRTPLDPRDLLEIEHHLLKFQTARGRRAYAVVNVNAPNPTPQVKARSPNVAPVRANARLATMDSEAPGETAEFERCLRVSRWKPCSLELERARRYGVRNTMSRSSVMSSIAQRNPSRPSPESLTPPYGIGSTRHDGTSPINTAPTSSSSHAR